ncbi:MAG: PAS domain S-box protein [Smithella sp.]
MTAKRRIREINDTRECNKVNDMPFSVTDGEKAVILESIPDPVVMLDTDLKVLWSNAAMKKLFNLDADQLAGRLCFEKMHGLKKPCSICPVVKAINTGQSCTVDDFSSLGKRWMMRAYPLRDDKGNITRVVEIVTDITESKRAEDKLNNVRKLQSMILDNSTVGIAFVRNRIHEWVNPRLCEIYGIPKEQLEGSSTSIIFPDEESYQRQGEEIYSLLALGKKATIENQMRKGDGSLFWCRLEGTALDASKPHEGSIWIVEDITKRKQAEEEIQKLNRLQSVILDNSAVGIAFVRNRTLEWVNRKMSELFGIPVEQIQGLSTRFLNKDDETYNKIGSEVYPLLAQGKNATIETQMLKGNGLLIWCKLEGIVLDQSKPQDGSIWIFEDITERKQAEETLRRSEEKYRGLIEGLNEALFRLTLPDGKFEYFSPSAANVLGYNAEEIIANPLLIKQAMHPDFKGFLNEKFKELKKGKVFPTYEYKIIDSEGNERWILQSNKGIIDDDGKLVALEGLCRDISERKRAEEALERRIMALTKPLGDIENIAFEDLFNISELQHLQNMLADAWGVAILLTRPDGTLITQPSNFSYFCREFIRKNEKGLRNCRKSDALLGRYNPSGPTIQRCLSAGLWGAGTSITVGGRHIASWLIGQVRNEAQSEKQIVKYARKIGVDEDKFHEAFLQVPIMPQEKFEQITHTLFALANQLSAIAYQNIQQARFIAERKQAEEALRESETKYRHLHESMTEAFVIVDMNGRIQEFNHAYQSILGYSEEELRHLTYSDLTPTKWHAFEKSIIEEQILVHGYSKVYEKEYQRKDGSVFPVELSSFLIRDNVGNPIGMWGIARDITERKLAETMLQESEEKYNQFFKTSRDCVFITSKDGRLIDLNDATVELFGYSSRQELLQMKIPFVYANEAERAKHAGIIAEGGYTKEYPVDLRRRDGVIRHTLITAVARRDEKGKTIGFQGTIRDITERRQIEEERERLILELQEAIAQVKTLSGLLPICASCKKIRDDNGYWMQIEAYIKDHSEAEFSHSICPDCVKKLYPELENKK